MCPKGMAVGTCMQIPMVKERERRQEREEIETERGRERQEGREGGREGGQERRLKRKTGGSEGERRGRIKKERKEIEGETEKTLQGRGEEGRRGGGERKSSTLFDDPNSESGASHVPTLTFEPSPLSRCTSSLLVSSLYLHIHFVQNVANPQVREGPGGDQRH